jgi:hypothetical protein
LSEVHHLLKICVNLVLWKNRVVIFKTCAILLVHVPIYSCKWNIFFIFNIYVCMIVMFSCIIYILNTVNMYLFPFTHIFEALHYSFCEFAVDWSTPNKAYTEIPRGTCICTKVNPMECQNIPCISRYYKTIINQNNFETTSNSFIY